MDIGSLLNRFFSAFNIVKLHIPPVMYKVTDNPKLYMYIKIHVKHTQLLCMYRYVRVCVCVCVCVRVLACVYACMHVRTYVCMQGDKILYKFLKHTQSTCIYICDPV